MTHKGRICFGEEGATVLQQAIFDLSSFSQLQHALLVVLLHELQLGALLFLSTCPRRDTSSNECTTISLSYHFIIFVNLRVKTLCSCIPCYLSWKCSVHHGNKRGLNGELEIMCHFGVRACEKAHTQHLTQHLRHQWLQWKYYFMKCLNVPRFCWHVLT